MLIAGVVADANVLLSAVVGKAALRVFTQFQVVVHVAQFNADEVAEYLPYMASKYELPVELVEMQWKLLPFRRHPLEEYRSWLPQAIADLKDRDPEDAHVLALARLLAVPIWSNDRDLSGPPRPFERRMYLDAIGVRISCFGKDASGTTRVLR